MKNWYFDSTLKVEKLLFPLFPMGQGSNQTILVQRFTRQSRHTCICKINNVVMKMKYLNKQRNKLLDILQKVIVVNENY